MHGFFSWVEQTEKIEVTLNDRLFVYRKVDERFMFPWYALGQSMNVWNGTRLKSQAC